MLREPNGFNPLLFIIYISHATVQFAEGISMAHACTTELQPAIADVLPSIAHTILSKVHQQTGHS